MVPSPTRIRSDTGSWIARRAPLFHGPDANRPARIDPNFRSGLIVQSPPAGSERETTCLVAINRPRMGAREGRLLGDAGLILTASRGAPGMVLRLHFAPHLRAFAKTVASSLPRGKATFGGATISGWKASTLLEASFHIRCCSEGDVMSYISQIDEDKLRIL